MTAGCLSQVSEGHGVVQRNWTVRAPAAIISPSGPAIVNHPERGKDTVRMGGAYGQAEIRMLILVSAWCAIARLPLMIPWR